MSDTWGVDRLQERVRRARQRFRNQRRRGRRQSRQLSERGDRLWRYYRRLRRERSIQRQMTLLSEQHQWLNIYGRTG